MGGGGGGGRSCAANPPTPLATANIRAAESVRLHAACLRGVEETLQIIIHVVCGKVWGLTLHMNKWDWTYLNVMERLSVQSPSRF